ncbi:WXG100 family type VII secretion target [Amycolatopsis samaneae]|uniref:WXG100 family type VII secretion target n=1 Tax=Amycolatopsis samaneae TaxID=664691 RepID=A0ABW5GRG6_9PSEU
MSTSTSKTGLTPDQVKNVAKQHANVAAQIDGRLKALRTQIDAVVHGNRGQMIQALASAHQTWDADTAEIIKNLNIMAGDMQTAAKELFSQDESGAQDITKAASSGSENAFSGLNR